MHLGSITILVKKHFKTHHPKYGLRQKVGLIRHFRAKFAKFAKLVKLAFPHRHSSTLDIFTRTIRMRRINLII
jgi:hypothetical protein